MKSRPALVALAVAVLMGITACGSSSPSASKHSSSSVTSSVAAAVGARMKAEDGLLGTPRRSIAVQDAHDFASGDDSLASQLKKEHMDGGASQHLTVPGTDDAIRSVLHFTTSTAASKDAHVLGSGARTFAVPGIPDAIGTEYGRGTDVKGRNITFVSGSYEYVLGVSPHTDHSGPSRATMITDATSWYDKVSALS